MERAFLGLGMTRRRARGVCGSLTLGMTLAGCGGLVEDGAPSPKTADKPMTTLTCTKPSSIIGLGGGTRAAASPSGCLVAIISADDEQSLRIVDREGKTHKTIREEGKIRFVEGTTFAAGRLLYIVARLAPGPTTGWRPSGDLVARDREGEDTRHVLAENINAAWVTSDRAAFAVGWTDGERGDRALSIPLASTGAAPIVLAQSAHIDAVAGAGHDEAAILFSDGRCDVPDCSAPQTRGLRYVGEWCGSLRFVRLDGSRDVALGSAARILAVHRASGRIALERTLPNGGRVTEIAFPNEGRPSLELRRFAPATKNAAGESVCDGASVTFTPDGESVVIDADHVVMPQWAGPSSSCPSPIDHANATGRNVTLARLDGSTLGSEQTIGIAPDALVLRAHARGLVLRREDVVSFVGFDGHAQSLVRARSVSLMPDVADRYIVQTLDTPSSGMLLDVHEMPALRTITPQGDILQAWVDGDEPRWFLTTKPRPACDAFIDIAHWRDLKPTFVDLAAGTESAIDHWPIGMVGRDAVLYSDEGGFALGPIPR